MGHIFKSVGKIIKPIASIAAVATGNPELLPLINGGADLLSGKSPLQALGSAGMSFLGSQAIGALGNAFPETFGSIVGSGGNTLTDLLGKTSGAGNILNGNFLTSPLQSLGLGGGSSVGSSPLSNVGNGESWLGDLKAASPGSVPDSLSSSIKATDLTGLDPSITSQAQTAGGSKGILQSLIDKIKEDPLHALATGANIYNTLNTNSPAQSIADQQKAQAAKQASDNAKFISSLNSEPLQRSVTNAPQDYYHYGERSNNPLFFDNPNPAIKFAAGGMACSPLATSKMKGMKKGGSTSGIGGQDDTISAKLSAGEYVVPADVVSSLGDGNSGAGGKALDGMLKNVRQHKAPAMKKGVLPPKAKSPLAYAGAH